jgi:hypothetical protein
MNIMLTAMVGTATQEIYVPVPGPGRVVSLQCSFGKTVAADDTVDIQRDSTSVNLITVGAANTAAGVLLTGTPDSTNSNLEFDPSSDTAANKVIHIAVAAVESTLTPLTMKIVYDLYNSSSSSSSGVYSAVTAS